MLVISQISVINICVGQSQNKSISDSWKQLAVIGWLNNWSQDTINEGIYRYHFWEFKRHNEQYILRYSQKCKELPETKRFLSCHFPQQVIEELSEGTVENFAKSLEKGSLISCLTENDFSCTGVSSVVPVSWDETDCAKLAEAHYETNSTSTLHLFRRCAYTKKFGKGKQPFYTGFWEPNYNWEWKLTWQNQAKSVWDLTIFSGGEPYLTYTDCVEPPEPFLDTIAGATLGMEYPDDCDKFSAGGEYTIRNLYYPEHIRYCPGGSKGTNGKFLEWCLEQEPSSEFAKLRFSIENDLTGNKFSGYIQNNWFKITDNCCTNGIIVNNTVLMKKQQAIKLFYKSQRITESVDFTKVKPEKRNNGWTYIIWQDIFPNIWIRSPNDKWYQLIDTGSFPVCFPQYDGLSTNYQEDYHYSYRELVGTIDEMIADQTDSFATCFKPFNF